MSKSSTSVLGALKPIFHLKWLNFSTFIYPRIHYTCLSSHIIRNVRDIATQMRSLERSMLNRLSMLLERREKVDGFGRGILRICVGFLVLFFGEGCLIFSCCAPLD